MPDKKKLAIGLGIAGATAALIYAATRKPPEVAPPEIYTCPVCGAEFSIYEDLLAHIELEHPEVPPPPVYTCPYCGAQFATEAELNYHIETVHPPAVPPFAGANINILSVDNIRVVSSGYSDSKPYYVLQQPMVKGTRPEFNITIEIIKWSVMDYYRRLFVLIDVLDNAEVVRVVSGTHSIPLRRVDAVSDYYFEPGEIVTIPISYYDPFLAGYQASLPRGLYHLKIEFDSGDTWWESARIQGLSTFWIFNALQIR